MLNILLSLRLHRSTDRRGGIGEVLPLTTIPGWLRICGTHRRKRGNRKLVCSGCGRKLADAYDTYEREVRDLPCFEFLTTVVVELYRVRCPDCGVKTEKVPQLPSKAPFSKRFEEAVGLACESAAVRRVARQFGLSRAARSEPLICVI